MKRFKAKSILEQIARNKEHARVWNINNREKRLDSKRKWEIKNKEKRSEYQHVWYVKNKEKQLAYARKWSVKNREKKRFITHQRRILKRNILGFHTLEQWLELKKKYFNMCLCCKQFEPIIKLTEDHIIPLSMGGLDNIGNIQPLCDSCNKRKYTKTISYLPIDTVMVSNYIGERVVI